MKPSVIVIGAGIVGLAHARAAAEKGYKVTVLEKNELACSASIRNFGMVWPIGQPAGQLFNRALRSKNIWKQFLTETNTWHSAQGSMHLVYHQDEQNLVDEYLQKSDNAYTKWLSKDETISQSHLARENNLKGSLFSETEVIVDPREAIDKLPAWLNTKYGIEFEFRQTVVDINKGKVKTSRGDTFEADKVIVCSGSDFETLYPQIFEESPLNKCKLQMMRTAPVAGNTNLGPALCAGLTFAHYGSFAQLDALTPLKKRFDEQYPEHKKYGVHVLVSQTESGQLTLGDSHEYEKLNYTPFNKESIDQLTLSYLNEFLKTEEISVSERWLGIYAKMMNGQTEFIHEVDEQTLIVNGLSGAGMTLSFGLAEEISELYF